MTVLARNGDVWTERAFQDGQVIARIVLPGLAVRVADLWLDAEPLDPEPNRND